MDKMKIIFKWIDEQHIDILCKESGNVIGHIFSPSGTGEVYSNAIQVCGFEEEFDLWGCGVFGERVEEKICFTEDKIDRMKKLSIDTGDKFWKEWAEKGYDIVIKQVMKKDIQLRFKDYINSGICKNDFSCFHCYNKPCSCNELKLNRDWELKDKLE